MNDFTRAEYTVDLTREEYVRSQEILGKRASGLTNGARVFSVAMLAVCIGMGVFEFRHAGRVDWSLLSLLALLVGSELWMMLSIPKQLSLRHESAYDAAVFGGHRFVGTVTVEDDAIRKRTPSATTVIPYEQCRLYVETAEMMIFCPMDGNSRSIVIPARYLTEQTAEVTRQAALGGVPPVRQMLLGKLVPGAVCGEPFCAPPQTESTETLLTLEVDYTDNEIVGIAAETALEKFAASLPNKSILMTMLASVGYFGMNIPPLPLFLTAMLIMFFASVISARIRMRRVITHTERAICRVRVEFTDAYVLLLGKADGMRPLRLPWSYITRAIDCRNTVELYAGNNRQLSIPKRCIPDFERLRDIIDSHM